MGGNSNHKKVLSDLTPQYVPNVAGNRSIRKIQSRMCFQEKSPYTKDRPHEREGRESRDKQYPLIYIIS